MKRFILIFIVLFLLFVSIGYAEVKQDAQKFKLTYTIIYNEQTLEQAAKTEAIVKEKFKDACSVSVKAEELKEGYATMSFSIQ
jgi:hypothetical protein